MQSIIVIRKVTLPQFEFEFSHIYTDLWVEQFDSYFKILFESFKRSLQNVWIAKTIFFYYMGWNFYLQMHTIVYFGFENERFKSEVFGWRLPPKGQLQKIRGLGGNNAQTFRGQSSWKFWTMKVFRKNGRFGSFPGKFGLISTNIVILD